MNILQIGTFDKVGGAAKVSYRLKNALESMGHTTSMFVHKKYSNDKNIFEIPRNLISRGLSKIFASDIDFGLSDNILKTEEFKKADIIHCHNLHGNFFKLSTLKKMAKTKPVVWTLHDMWSISGHTVWGYDYKESPIPTTEASPAIIWNSRKRLLRKKQRLYNVIKPTIIPVSHWLENELKSSILKDQNIQTIHNGINTQIFKRYDKKESRSLLQLPNDTQYKKIITFISNGGSNNRQKGWEYAEKIIKDPKNKNILFLCIGGDADKQIENIKYIKAISDENILAQYYSASDALLFTSLIENFPLVTLEAMACGTPILAFDVGGTKEGVIHLENGYIAKYKDTEDIQRGLEWLIGLSDDEISSVSDKCISRVNTLFTIEVMTENYIRLYKKLI
jgi:glycosyltransferase involved in cell wall biosynthesis